MRRAVERVALPTLPAALLRPDRACFRAESVRGEELDADAVPPPLRELLADEVMPTPNSGGLALELLPEPLDPDVSCLAAGMGI